MRKYLHQNRQYFEAIDVETYQAVREFMHSERVMKDMTNSRKGTRINMCKALEDIYEEGREEGRRETAINLSELGVPVETIASAVKVSVKEVQEWLAGNAGPV